MTSWKTTVGGLCSSIGIALIGIAMTQAPVLLWLLIVGTVLSAGGSALLGVTARDNDKSSEDVGVNR